MSPSFRELYPPHQQTHSFGATPCTHRLPLRVDAAVGAGAAGYSSCPYGGGTCAKISAAAFSGGRNKLSTILAAGLRMNCRVTLAETTSSVVARAEHLFHGQEQYRFTVRKHLYESLSVPQPEPGPHCAPLGDADRLGVYAGFIDLRQMFDAIPVAMAVLGVPRFFRNDPAVYVVSGVYGPLFGGPAFSSTVYSMHDPITGGSACAQACVIMLAGMVADRGATVEGSYALTFWGNEGQRGGIPSGLVPPGEQPPDEMFPAATGLDEFQIAAALGKCKLHPAVFQLAEAVGTVWEFKLSQDAIGRLALRVIQAYATARYPVILQVDVDTWVGNGKRELGHAVAIVGVTKPDTPSVPVFVVHDPGMQPYLRKPVAAAFKAARALMDPEEKIPAIRFVTATEHKLRTPIDCLRLLPFHDPDLRSEVYPHVGGDPASADVRFELLARHEIPEHVWQHSITLEGRESVAAWLALPAERYWVVGLYDKGLLRVAWLFDAAFGAPGGCVEVRRVPSAGVRFRRTFRLPTLPTHGN